MHIITIDAGTTNTRCSLWRDHVILARAQREVGVRNTALDGHNGALKQAVRDTISDVLGAANVNATQVELVLASGMISSAQGLVEVPHLTGPVGLKQLAQGMQQVAMPDVVQQPLWIIPGVRNPLGAVDISNFEAMDMMRGEEVEVMGLIARLELSGQAVFIMPGSHTKLINIDEQGRIAGCATTIAGELLQVITQGTLISQSLQGSFADSFVPEMVRAGALAAQKTGLARACFGVRTLANFAQIGRNELANFLLGAVLSSDLQALKNSSAIQMHPDTPIVISGKTILRQTLELLLQEQNFFYGQRRVASDAEQADLAGFGALCVAGARGLIDSTSSASPSF